MSTELAEAPSQELSTEQLAAESERLAASFKARITPDEIALPLIKLTQALSKEVQQGRAQAGQFINSVTGKVYEQPLELVIVDRFKGRFHADKQSDRAYAARGDIAPDNWPDKYAGQRFSDLPDSEEQFKEAVNRGDVEWGSGPPISTTHNYIGFVRGETDVPVRLSLMRTSTPAATAINTLLKLQRAPWDAYISLTADENVNSRGQKSYKVQAAEGESTTDEDKGFAVKLAINLENVQNVVLVGDDTDAAGPAKPKAAAGAMSID